MRKLYKNLILINLSTLLLDIVLYSITLTVLSPSITKVLTLITAQPFQIMNWIVIIAFSAWALLLIAQIHNTSQSLIGGLLIIRQKHENTYK